MQSIENSQQNFLWKNVDISHDSSLEKLKNEFLEKLPNGKSFFTPINLEIKEFLGLEINQAVLIWAPPRRRSTIHTDYRSDNLKLALNIPLKNCEESITEMWDCGNNNSEYSLTNIGVPYNSFELSQCKKITEFKLITPVIFNTKIPHSVINFSKEPRLAISLRFKIDPWHLVDL